MKVDRLDRNGKSLTTQLSTSPLQCGTRSQRQFVCPPLLPIVRGCSILVQSALEAYSCQNKALLYLSRLEMLQKPDGYGMDNGTRKTRQIHHSWFLSVQSYLEKYRLAWDTVLLILNAEVARM